MLYAPLVVPREPAHAVERARRAGGARLGTVGDRTRVTTRLGLPPRSAKKSNIPKKCLVQVRRQAEVRAQCQQAPQSEPAVGGERSGGVGERSYKNIARAEERRRIKSTGNSLNTHAVRSEARGA